ncbi:MAG: 4-hydroxythreonine-4-phosphate dehydrogenase PdxA [candidate division KSB1 bacterium]|nr:4-hydroxythreonine-4-phosphate dehydrogenase PdxA [candidate division KSB1 bacterium]
MSERPILGITMGDPAGVGPEIALKAFQQPEVHELCRPLVIGDARVLEKYRSDLVLPLQVRQVSRVAEAEFSPDLVEVLHQDTVDVNALRPGTISAMAGNAAFLAIRTAIELALRGEIDGTVTNPIHKEALNLAGHHFAGHTEIYGQLTGAEEVAMLLVHENLRVVHVSTHVPLRKACDAVKKARIIRVTELLREACIRFGIADPRIGIAGLNPHASDGGLFGDEEAREIIPAVEELRRRGWRVEGPLPPDVIFPRLKAGFYDGCVAMYHDQGHIPFKMETFVWDRESGAVRSIRGVNITLGLPIIRTSVDHGTAFDIVGKGIADPQPLVDAIRYAAMLARKGSGSE